VFGTLHEPVDGGAKQPIGGFWRLRADLVLEKLPLESVAISNSLAFSPDGGTLYYCDSLTRMIRCCDYGEEISNRRDFADLRGSGGEPDGSCVDAEGGLWNAQWGSGRVLRYHADGSVDRILPLPARQPTRPAFGGAALSTLYVTSARDGLDADALSGEPLSGALFAAQVDVRGLPEPRFAGVPPVGDTP
jgi:L-arabinonolactonase